MRIKTSFASFAQQSHSPQSQEVLEISLFTLGPSDCVTFPAVTEVHSTASLDTGNKSEICAEFVEKEKIIEDLTLREQTNSRDIKTASSTNLNSLVELDIGTIEKKNLTQMDLFLKMTCFNIPSTIPRDAVNSAFPLRLLTKTLPNGKTSTRDWLCWSKEKQSMYCVPCFIANKNNANQSSFSAQSKDGILSENGES